MQANLVFVGKRYVSFFFRRLHNQRFNSIMLCTTNRLKSLLGSEGCGTKNRMRMSLDHDSSLLSEGAVVAEHFPVLCLREVEFATWTNESGKLSPMNKRIGVPFPHGFNLQSLLRLMNILDDKLVCSIQSRLVDDLGERLDEPQHGLSENFDVLWLSQTEFVCSAPIGRFEQYTVVLQRQGKPKISFSVHSTARCEGPMEDIAPLNSLDLPLHFLRHLLTPFPDHLSGVRFHAHRRFPTAIYASLLSILLCTMPSDVHARGEQHLLESNPLRLTLSGEAPFQQIHALDSLVSNQNVILKLECGPDICRDYANNLNNSLCQFRSLRHLHIPEMFGGL
jgi:hypothetical protein